MFDVSFERRATRAGESDYNYFRDYDPSIGRYVESDPIGLEGGANTFVYVRSRATARVDPWGLLDIFIGGFGDSMSHIVSDYRQSFSQDNPGRSTLYYGWDQSDEIVKAIKAAKAKRKCEPINIIGHSYGGSTAASVSSDLKASGINVDLLVTVDPVSRFWSQTEGSASNWIDVNADPATSNGLAGDFWAFIGGKWGDWPKGKANKYYTAPYHHNQFGGLFEHVPADGKSALQELLNARSACSCVEE